VNREEEELIRAFVVREKQERLLGFAANPRRRAKFTRTLYHFGDFDRAYVVAIPPAAHGHDAIEKLLTQHGAAKTCYVISTNKQIDQQTISLGDVLETIVGRNKDGTILSCVTGRLGYYEGEGPRDRHLLVRRAG
jgi:hypothetical protein